MKWLPNLPFKMPWPRELSRPMQPWTHFNSMRRVWICSISTKRLLISHPLFPVLEAERRKHRKVRLRHGVINREEKADCLFLCYPRRSALAGGVDNIYQERKVNTSAHFARSLSGRGMIGHDTRRAFICSSIPGSVRRILTTFSNTMPFRLLNAASAILLSPRRHIGKNTSFISVLTSPQTSVLLVGKTICGSICASSMPVPSSPLTSMHGVE